MATQTDALQIGDVTELELRLSKLARQFPQAGAVTVAFTDVRHECRAFTTPSRDGDEMGLPAGCMAKLFTSALLSRLVLLRKINPDDSVVALLPIHEREVRAQLVGVTVAHLLNHAHGLDDSALGAAPLLSNGSIDCNALCSEMVSAPSLFAPGALYNYGHGGGYLAGAIVEQLYAMPFASVLQSELLEPHGLRLVIEEQAGADAVALVCPSTGGDWYVTELQLLKLLAQQLAAPESPTPSPAADHLSIMRACSQRLPGWSPTEKSINLGWKGYGWDWYGHDGRSASSSLLARINAKGKFALVISCVGFSGIDPSYVLLSRLFRDWFPEIGRIDAPRSIDPAAAQDMDLGAFTGTYRTRASTVVVGRTDRELFVRLGDQGGRPHRLIAAADNLFLTAPAVRDAFPFMQFIRPAADGRHEYLWNGQNVWRRCA